MLVRARLGLVVVGVLVVAGCTSGPDPTPDTPDSQQLAAGVRAEPGQVGYLGDPADLARLGPDVDPPEGTRWVEGTLEVTGDDVVLDHVHVEGSIDYLGEGTLTIRQSVVEADGSLPAVVWGRSATAELDISDSTIRWPADVPSPTADWGTGAVNGDARMTVVRCDISGTPDGIQQGSGDSRIEQNVIHDLRLEGEYPDNTHNDGIQFYGGADIVVRDNWIDLDGFDGTHQNAAVFLAAGPGYADPVIEGNYLYGGGYALRLGAGTSGAVVGDNHFGPLGDAFGLVLLDPGVTIASWTDNTWDDGTVLEEPPPT